MTILQPLSKNCYVIPRQGKMRVEARIYLSKRMAHSFHEKETLAQLMDAASLPGVYKYVLGMPDIHKGFGLPIGGVMAMDTEDGVVSSGAVGMDINCGVRLLKTNIPASEMDKPLLRKIMQAITARVPTGIGKESRHARNIKDVFNKIVTGGVPTLIEMGIGRGEDTDSIEEQGRFPGADLKSVSKKAISRSNQLSTIGGGNHFIEIGHVAEVFDRNFADMMGLKEGYLTILIHTGSRGFGHQICTDYSRSMKKDAARMKIFLPNAGLASV
ncbi:MAG: RtcB family protein, partial [Firmicutes bacterium]|nr:RtcB family protein [Bacillota bacterium]